MTYELGLHHLGGFCISMTFTKTLAGRIYPNGQFGIGIIRRFKTDYVKPKQSTQVKTWEENRNQVHGLLPSLQYLRSGLLDESELPVVSQANVLEAALDSSLGSNSHKGKRGLNGITGHGKNLVRNAALLLEKRYGCKHLTFLTLTLPEMGEDAWKQIGADWARIVKVVTQWVSRRLGSVGLPPHVVSVTEVQSHRFERVKSPGYHLHMVFVGRKPHHTWSITPAEIRSAWKRAVVGTVGAIAEGVSWQSCENMQAVRFSAGGYLGKYMSKGAESVGEVAALYGSDCLPSTWYNCTSILRLAVKTSCQRLSDEECRDVLRIAAAEDGSGGFIRHICLSHDGYETVVGWFGRVTAESMRVTGFGRKNLAKAIEVLGKF